MTDLEILIGFRQAEADGHVSKLTKLTHECTSHCRTCLAQQACSTLAHSDTDNDFDCTFRPTVSFFHFFNLLRYDFNFRNIFSFR